MLAGTIGSRAVGTPANTRAREYVIDQLRLYGFEVRVQETDARRAELGATAHVFNIIAVRAGTERDAIGLVSHYDSSPDAPGAADDGLGVAVSLEAARVLAARANRRHSLFVLVTDGEEAGLMGAAGLVTDREVIERLQAYLNIEATGNDGAAMLFETGPGNSWLLRPWARQAPHPRGASYAIEIYRRLPNDTDFSVFKRHDVPGLNFAAVADSYAYHTARDTPERLTDRALIETGENVVQTVEALDILDVRRRDSVSQSTFFDIGRTVAVSWGPMLSWFLAAASLVCGLLAWFKALGASVRLLGLGRWLLDVLWTLLGSAFVAAAVVGGTWALRAARSVYHPWYAYPGRMFLMLVALGTLAGWAAMRAGGLLLPWRAHGERHPIFVWSVALPIWILLAGVTAARAPSAGYLWTLPLLVAGAGLLAIPVTNVVAVRAVSVLILAVSGTLWLRDTFELLRFVVALLGRLPLITPAWVYAALMLTAGVMVVPPLLAAMAAVRRLTQPAIETALLLILVVITGGLAYAAPAYTYDEPQRRGVRVFVEPNASTATYEVSSQEPGLDLDAGAPGGWYRATDTASGSVPWPRFALPFVFRTTAPSPGPAPGTATFDVKPVSGGSELTVTVIPQTPGLSVVFLAPPGVTPARSNIPGIVQRGRWRAQYTAIPADGVTWRAAFKTGTDGALAAATAILVSTRFPGGAGWQSLPSWIPQQNAVWHAELLWVLR